ncbi:MAG: hypothetical protein CVU39_15180 [Chloroflexi bacterium HGW-Chloroflexi-10]|nr:MAG: hypothetical protein CVU39_15180 [Chloroflexi bacterium HGW-Chloroflexi-10]
MEPKTTSRIERKKEETQKKIITTAVNLFKQYGLEAVTMEQIADVADIAKGTLYNYYPSKEAIINAFLQLTFKERNEDRLAQLRGLADTRTRLMHLFSLLIEGVQAQKEVFEVYMVYRMKQVLSFRPVEEERSGLTLLLQEIITLGRQSRELRSDLPETLLEELAEFALIAAIKPLYLAHETFNPHQSIQQCVDIFMNGAKANNSTEK